MKMTFSQLLKGICITGSLALHTAGFSQIKNLEFEDIENLQQKNQKNLIVFIYTDWCGFCNAMQKTTFSNAKVIETIHKDFYFIKLNAEEKRAIDFDNTTFRFKPTGKNTGIHELAKALATIDKKVSYPTLVVLNSRNEIIFQHSGFLKAVEVSEVLNTILKTQSEMQPSE
jgi:thioredoxin-related protein